MVAWLTELDVVLFKTALVSDKNVLILARLVCASACEGGRSLAAESPLTCFCHSDRSASIAARSFARVISACAPVEKESFGSPLRGSLKNWSTLLWMASSDWV